ncbi:hypothetical protein SAMN04487956_12535 [Halomonas saccharevitans]|uniref:Uncharacterized protein n=1 Tax=Halomonas saccharevitans TaxID=416872 RepID=A0A1I7BDN2_9GAMM|nr:hypothetical protein SAMN04487956_12535 [Halomonas saccharevitans]
MECAYARSLLAAAARWLPDFPVGVGCRRGRLSDATEPRRCCPVGTVSLLGHDSVRHRMDSGGRMAWRVSRDMALGMACAAGGTDLVGHAVGAAESGVVLGWPSPGGLRCRGLGAVPGSGAGRGQGGGTRPAACDSVWQSGTHAGALLSCRARLGMAPDQAGCLVLRLDHGGVAGLPDFPALGDSRWLDRTAWAASNLLDSICRLVNAASTSANRCIWRIAGCLRCCNSADRRAVTTGVRRRTCRSLSRRGAYCGKCCSSGAMARCTDADR